MRGARRPIRITLFLLCLILGTGGPITPSFAQGGQATLVGRALLPANTLADGPRSGLKAFVPSRELNGIRVPFDSQPVGSISDIMPGAYAGTWLALSDGVYNSRQNSDDYLLRIYTLEIDMFRGNSGGGSVNVLDWKTLADPGKKAQGMKNANTKDRSLTGADFDVRAFARAKDGSFWVGDAYGPSLLHFNANGALLAAPIALGGAGALQGLGITPNNAALIVAQKSAANNGSVSLRTFDLSKQALSDTGMAYSLDNPSNTVSDLKIISATTMIVIEQDGQQNQGAKFKKIFLADFSASPAKKTPLVDLLDVADAQNISTGSVFQAPANAFGLGPTFMFPYADVSGVYPIDAQTLIVVNDNHVPFGLGRSTTQADDTDFAAIQVTQPMALDPAFRKPSS